MAIKKYSSGQWVDTPYRKYETATDTITTLPADVIADGQSASANIIGNMVQTGTPSPQSIIIPSETGDKTANLLATLTENYAIDASGNINSNNSFMYYTAPCEANETYTFSLDSGLSGSTVRIHAFNGDTWIEQLSGKNINLAPFTVTTPANTTNLKISITKDAKTYHCMLNVGEIAISYQPYGYKIPILSGGMTTNKYLGEVESTRQIKQLVLTGEEEWYEIGTGNGLFRITINDYIRQSDNIPICTHYKGVAPVSTTSELNNLQTAFLISSSGNNYYYVRDYNYNVESFKTYLQQQYSAGTPVTVWYVLATPTTGIVNEPIRKIGNYSDSVSVTGIPTTGTAESFDIDTTLKPSEVSLTYHGWHEHSDMKYTT